MNSDDENAREWIRVVHTRMRFICTKRSPQKVDYNVIKMSKIHRLVYVTRSRGSNKPACVDQLGLFYSLKHTTEQKKKNLQLTVVQIYP